jgi:Mrp family chromosome partitioning ATPase
VLSAPIRLLKRSRAPKPLPPPSEDVPLNEGAELKIPSPNSHVEIAPWDPNHQLHSYYDALRDRLTTWFEARKMTHHPKLVAVTSCSKGAGVSTIATGLAASLSEVGGGSVLLVDMNHHKAAAHEFSQGKPQCALHEALEQEKRHGALVHQNLYVASGNGTPDGLPRAMPKRFAQLMPKMKASDYDYIIFDMPPISQTSVTGRLAGFMDIVLMVVEADKTNRDAAKRARTSLAESNPNLAAIINRTHSHVPSWLLHQDH